MPGPYDYTVQQPNVLGAYLGGVQAKQQQVQGQETNALLRLQQQTEQEKSRLYQQQQGQGADKAAQEKQRAMIDDLAKATDWVQQAPTPQEQAQRWNQVIDTYKPVMGDAVEQYRDPRSIGPVSAWAKREQAKWSTPQAVVGPDGKPAFGQVNDAGQSRIIPGMTPPPKEADQPKPVDARPIRQEFTTQAQPFVAVRDASRKVETATDSAAGDMSLVFGYMKMLDPGSTVREGEYALAEQARGVPETVLNMYNKALKGERLSPEQRTAFKGEAKKVYAVAKRGYDQLKNQYKGIAKRAGANPEDVIVDYENDAPVEAPSAAPEVQALLDKYK